MNMCMCIKYMRYMITECTSCTVKMGTFAYSFHEKSYNCNKLLSQLRCAQQLIKTKKNIYINNLGQYNKIQCTIVLKAKF